MLTINYSTSCTMNFEQNQLNLIKLFTPESFTLLVLLAENLFHRHEQFVFPIVQCKSF